MPYSFKILLMFFPILNKIENNKLGGGLVLQLFDYIVYKYDYIIIIIIVIINNKTTEQKYKN